MKTTKFIFLSFLLASIVQWAHAQKEIGLCFENKGYIEKKSLIHVIDVDCTEVDGPGLCSVLLGTPAKVDGRSFSVFTFKHSKSNRIDIYLNLQAEKYHDEYQASFEVAKDTLRFVEVEAVYENIDGCTLRSVLNLGDAGIFPVGLPAD